MKKLMFAALLSLAGVGLNADQAKVWLFCHHCCRSCATICVKPYNAFSPSVFGSICADGCCPVQFGNHGPCGPPPPWYGAPCCAAPGCGGPGCAGMPGCGDGGCMAGPLMPPMMMAQPGGLPNLQAPPGAAPQMLPPGGYPNYQPPNPSPLPNGPAAPTTGGLYYPSGVQTAAYYGYAPTNYYPGYAQSYPSYWNMGNPNGR